MFFFLQEILRMREDEEKKKKKQKEIQELNVTNQPAFYRFKGTVSIILSNSHHAKMTKHDSPRHL